MAETKELTLTEVKKDAVGEIANMCMGSAATALSTILGRMVAITTPEVCNSSWEKVCEDLEANYVCVKVAYSEGIEGTNVLLFSQADALSIANIMIGMDATELTELELSAVGEVTNQMIGSSTTTLSNILNKMVDISPPDVSVISGEEAVGIFAEDEFLNGGFIQIKFRLEIEGLIDSNMIQIFPGSFADVFVDTVEAEATEMAGTEDIENDTEADNATVQGSANPINNMTQQPNIAQPTQQPMQMQDPQAMQSMPGAPGTPDMAAMMQGMMPMQNGAYMQGVMPNGMPYMYVPYQGAMPGGMPNNINVQTAQFNSFNTSNGENDADIENIDLIMDVPLEVTVELGRTNKNISEILEFKPGTIVELNKVAGDPIDILVNGKLVAMGEVVVIDENFGIRIVDIIK